ncbi:MAG: DUF1214 domain-containing protein [Anaerolineae bacterium]|jgi:hypothetical protein
MKDVNVANFARAESDVAIKKVYDMVGLGTWLHFRAPTPIDQQKVIRMNRDTLYSSAVLDLSEPTTVIMPETGGRYQSLHVISQDHYSFAKTEPGRYELTQEQVGSRYAYLIVRTFFDANDPDDLKATNALQDALKIEGGGSGELDIPDWNIEQMMTARDALNTLAKLGVSNVGAFGTEEEVDPIRHLIFTAAGWGGLPNKQTIAELGSVENNDGTPYVLTVKDAPVRAFWSVIVYDANGFIPENDLGIYSYNNVSAKPNADGSITIHFGGDPDQINYLPIAKGWNYAIRMYEPGEEILDGSWTFPKIVPVQ